jgi:hypothetical protein
MSQLKLYGLRGAKEHLYEIETMISILSFFYINFGKIKVKFYFIFQ